jgi:glutamate-1-semialdehyde 2,1-aminomutase
VIPAGMYGHLSVNELPKELPQFYDHAEGCHVWDVDGNEYVDLMCSFGPIILGHRHPAVERAASEQLARGDTMSGPGPCMVELAELLVDRVDHADWAMFAKNGTDATTLCLMIARAATGRDRMLAAKGAYHGAAPWCTLKLDGVTVEDRANISYYTYNDLESVERAFHEAGAERVAAVFVSPFRHDAGHDQELADPAFVRGLRDLCDRYGAALVMDEVRAGFRLVHGGSWEPFGVRPDLSAWSKGIANGYPLGAVLGNGAVRTGAERIFATGSFWFQSVPMAASVATINALRDENAIATMESSGQMLREGLAEQARAYGIGILQTGPVQMPNLSFAGDTRFERAFVFSATAADNGVILHPRHNWFLSAAHEADDIKRILRATDVAFAAVREHFAQD